MLNETLSGSSSADGQPQPHEIRFALQHLLAQPEFQGSNRIKKFLTFVVERHLAGQPELLKAQAIAMHVFDRDEHFDAHANPIVRVEATRLRKVLRVVYDRADFDEAVEIELPLGSYAPNFRYRRLRLTHAEQSAYAASALRVPVMRSPREMGWRRFLPHYWGGSAMFTLGGLVVISIIHFYDGVSGALPFKGADVESMQAMSDLRPLVFVHPFSHREMAPLEHLAQGKLQRKLTERLEAFDTLRLRIVPHTTLGRSDFHVISNFEAGPVGPVLSFARRDGHILISHQALLDTTTAPAEHVAQVDSEIDKAVAHFIGAAERELQLKSRRKQDLPEGLSCASLMRDFEASGGEALREASFKCMRQAAEGRSDSFLAQARLSTLWYDWFVTGKRSYEARDAMQEAFRFAQQSMNLAPYRGAGFSAYGRILLLTSADDDAALQFARAAFDLNPLDPDACAVLGATLVVLGQYVEGAKVLRGLIEAFPHYPSWVRLYLYVAAVELGDVDEQRRALAVSDRPDSPFAVLGRLAFNVTTDNKQAGREAFERLSSLDQAMSENPVAVFMRLRLRGPKMQVILHRMSMPR